MLLDGPELLGTRAVTTPCLQLEPGRGLRPRMSRQNPVLPETRVWIGFSPGKGERPAVVEGGQ